MTRMKIERVLAIDPAPKGFGFAVLEEPLFLVDWGVVSCPGRKPKRRRTIRRKVDCLEKVEKLILRYGPSVIMMEDCKSDSSRRCHDVQLFIGHVLKHTRRRKIGVRTVSPNEIRQTFHRFGANNKEEIAKVLAEQFPELLPLPRHRDPWMSEAYRMAIFDAVAMAISGQQRVSPLPFEESRLL